MASGLNSHSEAARVMSLKTTVTSPSGGATPAFAASTPDLYNKYEFEKGSLRNSPLVKNYTKFCS